MENREEETEELEVPTRTEIVEYILAWKQKPSKPVLGPNQITNEVLMEMTGFGYAWSKKRLRELYKAGVCEREIVQMKTTRINVYTFPDELPDF